MESVAHSDNGKPTPSKPPRPVDLTWLGEGERERILEERAPYFARFPRNPTPPAYDPKKHFIIGLFEGNRCRRCGVEFDPDVTDFEEHYLWHVGQEAWHRELSRVHDETADRASFLASLGLDDPASRERLRRHAQLYGLDGIHEIPPLEGERPRVPKRLVRRATKRRIRRSYPKRVKT